MKILDKLNISYSNIEIYKQAFTHTSYANEENCESYERLEYLGDAVLELIMSEYLYNNTNYPEGKMTKLRSSYVCENALYEYACILGINEEILLGRGEKDRDGKYNRTIVADVFESFIAAMFLDLGIDYVKKFIYDNIIPLIENNDIDFTADYKSVLQEMVQTDRKTLEYVVVNETGPAHAKKFEIVVKIDDIIYGHGEAHSKKEAEQQAAKDAIAKSQNGAEID
jgi:ribonuclease III, bacterial